MYNPEGNDSGREWLELINSSNQVINITPGKSGWRINDGSNHLFEENLSVNPGEIFVILQDRNLFLREYPNFSGKSILANFSLKNESGQIQIFDQNKNLVVSIVYQNSCGGNGNGYSIVFQNGQCFENKIKGGTPGKNEILLEENQPDNQKSQNIQEIDNNQKNNQTTINSTTTSIETSVSPEKTTSSLNNQEIFYQLLNLLSKNNQNQATSTFKEVQTTLIISEFLPNPEGNDKGKEFVEIYNYGDEEIDLDGFTLKIGDKEIKLNGKIEPQEYLVITNKEYSFYIKNKGDNLALYYQGEKIFEISYSGKAEEGKSYSRNSKGEWLFTQPTPGKENIFFVSYKDSDNLLNQQNNLKLDHQQFNNSDNYQEKYLITSQIKKSLDNKLVYILTALGLIFVLTLIVWLKL